MEPRFPADPALVGEVKRAAERVGVRRLAQEAGVSVNTTLRLLCGPGTLRSSQRLLHAAARRLAQEAGA